MDALSVHLNTDEYIKTQWFFVFVFLEIPLERLMQETHIDVLRRNCSHATVA
jgi:hypothetical protein